MSLGKTLKRYDPKLGARKNLATGVLEITRDKETVLTLPPGKQTESAVMEKVKRSDCQRRGPGVVLEDLMLGPNRRKRLANARAIAGTQRRMAEQVGRVAHQHLGGRVSVSFAGLNPHPWRED